MCGFAGIYHKGAYEKNLIEITLKKMNDTLIPRGPEEEGFFIDNSIALSHRRLKIIDLSENASQPMQLKKDGPVIVFNGEIYNFLDLKKKYFSSKYKFKSESDTEVIIHLYEKFGLKGLQELEGIFSFAIWDPKKDLLAIYRDRLGVKPIFFAESELGLVFGSEIKALLEVSGIDLSTSNQAFSEYLWYGNTFEERSFFEGIKSLLPGHSLIIEQGKKRIERWWKIEDWLDDPFSLDSIDVSDKVQSTLDKVVERQLISDAPIGLFLSGGIDSSAIAASIKDPHKSEISTYTAIFDFLKGVNESKKSSLVAKHLGLNHKIIKVEGSKIQEVIYDLSKAHDEPFADAANIPLYLMCKEVSSQIKVVLQGDGGDELFAGYNRYKFINNLNFFSFFSNNFFGILKIFGSYGRRAERILNALTENSFAKKMAYLLTLETKKNSPFGLLKEDKRRFLEINSNPFLAFENASERFKKYTPINRMLLSDINVQLPYQFLTKVDRSTMAAGIESRVPFLDEKLVKLSFKISSNQKIRNFQDKIVLRNSLKNRLPKNIVNESKVGFGVPYEYWLKTSLFEFTKERLLDENFLNTYNFERKKIEKKLNDHRQGNFNNGFTLWKLLQLAIWKNN
tara:strand:+ start:1878 stop:3746 length:1869 start_codon:yes stop_codon:yes gene_type:complete